jgi:hypothetical protein
MPHAVRVSPLVAYTTGWLAAAAIASALPIPLGLAALRRLRLPSTRLRRRLGLHYRLGAAAALLGVLHGLVSITRAPLPAPAEAGLWLACAAAVAVVFVALLGTRARDASGGERDAARRRHLALVLAMIVLVGLHVALDGPLPG